MVEALNWSWLGRVRNNTLYQAKTTDSWFPIKSLYLIATGKAKQIGQIILSRASPLQCYFYLYKKSPKRVGFSLNDTGTREIEHLNILLLIVFIASIGLRLIGRCAKENKLHYQFQANTIKHREVLSNIYLGWQILFSAPRLILRVDIKRTLENFTHYYS